MKQLQCAECGAVAEGNAIGWRTFLAYADGAGATAPFCVSYCSECVEWAVGDATPPHPADD
jgi:hypothetical protein